MNLFVLDKDPIKAAQLQCDKHVVKMIVEAAQMLSTTHRMLDGVETRKPSKSGKTMVKYYELSDAANENIMYKAVHFNHPCTIWTRESLQNYAWHYDHFMALCYEYQYRYKKIHYTQQILEDPLSIPPRNIPNKGLTPFRLAMDHEPQCKMEDPVESYQAYYKTKKSKFKMAWTGRSIPEWFGGPTVNV